MTTYSFDEFSFNCDTLSLQKNGVDILLRHQPAKLLKHLLEAAPGIVSRQTLQTEIWDDGVNVEFEQSLNACVNQLRSVLGDQARNARFIETLIARSSLIIALYWRRRDALCESHSHHALVDAIAANDGEQAEELMTSHLVDLQSCLDLRERPPSPRSLSDVLDRR